MRLSPYPKTVVMGEIGTRASSMGGDDGADHKPWTVSEEFWEKVQPLIPAAASHARGGRPRMSERKAFEAMIYVLRTGIQWNALPRELGASSTVHERFQEWERAGFFERLWQAGLAE